MFPHPTPGNVRHIRWQLFVGLVYFLGSDTSFMSSLPGGASVCLILSPLCLIHHFRCHFFFRKVFSTFLRKISWFLLGMKCFLFHVYYSTEDSNLYGSVDTGNPELHGVKRVDLVTALPTLLSRKDAQLGILSE